MPRISCYEWNDTINLEVGFVHSICFPSAERIRLMLNDQTELTEVTELLLTNLNTTTTVQPFINEVLTLLRSFF